MSVLLVAEEGEGDGACGIVYGCDEREVGATALEPVMLAAINLQQHAFLGIPHTPAVMLRSPAFAWALDSV